MVFVHVVGNISCFTCPECYEQDADEGNRTNDCRDIGF